MANATGTKMDPLDTPAEVALYIKVDEQTLANWRWLKSGPRFIRLNGGRIRYRHSDVEAWLEQHTSDGNAA